MLSECELYLEIRKAPGHNQTKQTNSKETAGTPQTSHVNSTPKQPLTAHVSDTNEPPPPSIVHVSDTNGLPQPPTQHTSETITKRMKPKLTKLILPRFSGDVTKFRGFWDSFKSAADENDELSVVDKFNYFQSLLGGPAAKSIQGLQLSVPNYEKAKQILEGRFGRIKQIIAAHMDDFLKIKAYSGDKPCI